MSTYGYNTAGQMRTTTYSDGPPNVAMTYNAQGQVATLSDGTGTRTLTYDAAGRRLVEQYTGGGRVDGLHFVDDPAGREVGYALSDTIGWATWQGWGYGTDGHQVGGDDASGLGGLYHFLKIIIRFARAIDRSGDFLIPVVAATRSVQIIGRFALWGRGLGNPRSFRHSSPVLSA